MGKVDKYPGHLTKLLTRRRRSRWLKNKSLWGSLQQPLTSMWLHITVSGTLMGNKNTTYLWSMCCRGLDSTVASVVGKTRKTSLRYVVDQRDASDDKIPFAVATCYARCSPLHGVIAFKSQALMIITEVINRKVEGWCGCWEGAGYERKRGYPLDLLLQSDFTPVHCGGSRGVSAAGNRWGLALTTLFRCSLVPSAPCLSPLLPPVSPSARRRRFWFWIEGLSCHSGAQASHWRSWAFSLVGSAQQHHVEMAPCTWPLGEEESFI